MVSIASGTVEHAEDADAHVRRIGGICTLTKIGGG
jgi:hypothetical protein